MRAYLSSYRMGNRFEELAEFLDRGAKVAVIENALDYIPLEERQTYARTGFSAVSYFIDYGLDAHALDLRDYFGRGGQLERALGDVKLAWAVGGNSFLLRKAMRQSGFDEIVARRYAQQDLVYGGWSAGAIVAGHSLRGLDLMDEPEIPVASYDDVTTWEGLGLVDFVIVPHFQSAHPESEKADRAAAWLGDNRFPYRTLRDGEVIVV